MSMSCAAGSKDSSFCLGCFLAIFLKIFNSLSSNSVRRTSVACFYTVIVKQNLKITFPLLFLIFLELRTCGLMDILALIDQLTVAPRVPLSLVLYGATRAMIYDDLS